MKNINQHDQSGDDSWENIFENHSQQPFVTPALFKDVTQYLLKIIQEKQEDYNKPKWLPIGKLARHLGFNENAVRGFLNSERGLKVRRMKHDESSNCNYNVKDAEELMLVRTSNKSCAA